jgi:hypothetical protein
MSPGDIAKAGSESAHQKALFAQCALKRYENPQKYNVLRWLYAIPNGGARDKLTASRMKAEGARAGVADLCLPAGRKGFYGLYIEMKKPGEINKTSAEQKEFIQHCLDENYAVAVCDHWEKAWQLIEDYLSEMDTPS